MSVGGVAVGAALLGVLERAVFAGPLELEPLALFPEAGVLGNLHSERSILLTRR